MRRTIARRRHRDRLFSASLFNDPAWDLLLDLFLAGIEGRQISVSSACMASAAPVSTALRHLRKLEQEGQVKRRGDPQDARRNYVTLSPSAEAKMLALFSSPPDTLCD